MPTGDVLDIRTGRRLVRQAAARAHAKANLHLGVADRDESGFHPLMTVFQALALADDVALTEADEHSVAAVGPYAGQVPTDERNLALAAVLALAEASGEHVPVEIRIDKRIPVAAGLGGGSADAAAALRAYASLVGLSADPGCEGLLAEVAAQLGSDVPFALRGGTALGTGRGTELAPVMARGPLHWVLATSPERLLAADVYARFDELGGAPSAGGADALAEPAGLIAALAAGDAAGLAAHLRNDLAEAAVSLLPGIADVLDAGTAAGALGALVCGSGPTVAFLAQNATHALELTVLLEASRGVESVIRTTGPAGGAGLID